MPPSHLNQGRRSQLPDLGYPLMISVLSSIKYPDEQSEGGRWNRRTTIRRRRNPHASRQATTSIHSTSAPTFSSGDPREYQIHRSRCRTTLGWCPLRAVRSVSPVSWTRIGAVTVTTALSVDTGPSFAQTLI